MTPKHEPLSQPNASVIQTAAALDTPALRRIQASQELDRHESPFQQKRLKRGCCLARQRQIKPEDNAVVDFMKTRS